MDTIAKQRISLKFYVSVIVLQLTVAERAATEPPRLGKHRFEAAPLAVLTSDEVTGSLRQIKVSRAGGYCRVLGQGAKRLQLCCPYSCLHHAQGKSVHCTCMGAR